MAGVHLRISKVGKSQVAGDRDLLKPEQMKLEKGRSFNLKLNHAPVDSDRSLNQNDMHRDSGSWGCS